MLRQEPDVYHRPVCVGADSPTVQQKITLPLLTALWLSQQAAGKDTA